MGIAKKNRKKQNKRDGSYDVNLNRPNPYGRVVKEKDIKNKNFGEKYIKTKEFKKQLFSEERDEMLALTKMVDPKKAFTKKGANNDGKGGAQ